MSKRKLAFLFVCAATVVSCNESVEWSSKVPCTDDTKSCDTNAVMICKDGEYVVLEECSADKPVCDPSSYTCVARQTTPCVPGCSGNILTICDENGNPKTEACSGATPICGKGTDNKPACVAGTPETCTPGCDGNVLTTCDESGNATTKNCEDDSLVCGTDTDGSYNCIEGEPSECVPGCDGNTLVVCNEDGTIDETNTKNCEDEGLICGVDENSEDACVPDSSNVKCTYGEDEDAIELSYGQSVCDEDGKVMTCQDDGTMSEAADCENTNQHCVPEEEGGVIGACVDYEPCKLGDKTVNNGDTTCSERNIVKCEKGEIVEDTICNDPEVCMTDADGMIVCHERSENDCDHNGTIVAENGKICNEEGTQIQICTAGDFVDVTENACTEDQLCVVVEHVPACVDCVVDVCADGQIQVCENGSLKEAADCMTMFTAEDNAETAACNSDGNACVIATCVDGYELNADGKCESATASCTANVCLEGKLQICDENGVLGAAEDCSGIDHAVTYNCKDAATCGVEECEAGYKVAADGVSCEEDTTPCTANVCLEGKIQVCGEGGILGAAEDCSGIEHAATYNCKDEATCGVEECEAGYKVAEDGVSCEEETTTCTVDVCKDGKFQACLFGELTDEEDCLSKITDSNAKTAKCNDEGTACIIEACKDGYALNSDNECEPVSAGCGQDMNGNDVADDSWFCADAHTVKSCLSGEVTTVSISCDAPKVCNPETINTTFQCEEPSASCTVSICSEGSIQVCESGVLAPSTPCPTVEHATKYGCKDASTCSVTECEAGFKVASDGVSCEVDVVCEAGKIQCDGTKLQECNSTGTAWEDVYNCGVDADVVNLPICLVSEESCVECVADTDCKDSTKPVCNTTKHECEAEVICEAGKIQCDGTKLQECNSTGTAWEDVYNCGVDTDVVNLPVCLASEESCVECVADTDCKDSTKPSCNTTKHECEAAASTDECNVDADCTTDPTKTKCDTSATPHVCVADSSSPSSIEIDFTAGCSTATHCIEVMEGASASYKDTWTYTLDGGVSVVVTGMFSDGRMNLTGRPSQPSSIVFSGLSGVSTVALDFEGGNASKNAGNEFTISDGTTIKTEQFTKAQARDEKTYTFNNASATSLTIAPVVPESGSKNDINRMYVYGVTVNP